MTTHEKERHLEELRTEAYLANLKDERIKELVEALRTILKRGYKLEASDYESAQAAIAHATGAKAT